MSERTTIPWHGFGTVFGQTDVRDPDGGYLYAYARVCPAWYWWLRRLWLFARVVWREYDSQYGHIAWSTAWAVSEAAVGLTRRSLLDGARHEALPWGARDA